MFTEDLWVFTEWNKSCISFCRRLEYCRPYLRAWAFFKENISKSTCTDSLQLLPPVFVSKQSFFPFRLFILADLLLKPLPVWPWAFCQVGSMSGHQFRVFFFRLPCYSSRHKDVSTDTKILILKVFMEAWCHYNFILCTHQETRRPELKHFVQPGSTES